MKKENEIDVSVTTEGGEVGDLDPGTGVSGANGGATATDGIAISTEQDNPEFYAKAIDKRITEVRPWKSSVKSDTIEMAADSSYMTLPVNDASLFSVTDTIRVVDVKGYNEDGTTRNTLRDLMLYVVGKSENEGYPQVIAVNGKRNTTGMNSLVPALSKDTVLIRMGRAAGESDAEAG